MTEFGPNPPHHSIETGLSSEIVKDAPTLREGLTAPALSVIAAAIITCPTITYGVYWAMNHPKEFNNLVKQISNIFK